MWQTSRTIITLSSLAHYRDNHPSVDSSDLGLSQVTWCVSERGALTSERATISRLLPARLSTRPSCGLSRLLKDNDGPHCYLTVGSRREGGYQNISFHIKLQTQTALSGLCGCFTESAGTANTAGRCCALYYSFFIKSLAIIVSWLFFIFHFW